MQLHSNILSIAEYVCRNEFIILCDMQVVHTVNTFITSSHFQNSTFWSILSSAAVDENDPMWMYGIPINLTSPCTVNGFLRRNFNILHHDFIMFIKICTLR